MAVQNIDESLVKLQIIKMEQISATLAELGFEYISLELACLAHDLELKLRPPVTKAPFPENFE